MCRYIGVDRGRYTNSLVPPLSVSVYHCQGNVAKFRCNNGSLFSRGRQPRFLFGAPVKSTSPRNEGEGEETWPSKRNGGKRERERKSLSTKEEGFRYGLPRCLHWHAINGLRNSHEARYGEELDPRAHFSVGPSLFRASCRDSGKSVFKDCIAVIVIENIFPQLIHTASYLFTSLDSST